MKRKKTNYHRSFVCSIVILSIITVIILITTKGYWQALAFLPLLIIIWLAIRKSKKEEKNKKFLSIKQYYQYPKK
ncbi:MAG: hypothetical protein IJX20_01440 [Alphaproteobacteria bacterium]|nr:hypothetical protein [Alphaproteobacteria bacterium]